MNKEEILKKAQSRKPNQMDEMEMDIFQKSSYIGMTVGLIMCVVLMIINIYCNQPYQDVYSVFCSILCGQYMYRWIRQKDKFTLFCGICWGFVAIFYLSYILQKYFYNDYKVLLMNDELILKNNLKQVRTEKKLSQSALAEMVGVSRNTISSIETGQFNPTAKLALILCIALDKKFEELFYF